jgi:hypothetical protein
MNFIHLLYTSDHSVILILDLLRSIKVQCTEMLSYWLRKNPFSYFSTKKPRGKELYFVWHQVLTASSIKMAAFWVFAPCSLLVADRHLTGPSAFICRAMMRGITSETSVNFWLHSITTWKAATDLCFTWYVWRKHFLLIWSIYVLILILTYWYWHADTDILILTYWYWHVRVTVAYFLHTGWLKTFNKTFYRRNLKCNG